MGTDKDYEWLLSHVTGAECLEERALLAERVADLLNDRIQSGKLPYTIGVFGGWGCGKTTFLALLAKRLEEQQDRRVIYFNS